ncbi:hypothetical protein EDE05_10549 [Neorhizobium sp. R1-B]|jgi:hypothetical protein|uniref:hypothetical protein n=1 Tax=Neorhizobium sp. R1-B TaxID=2485162 RepID=UPI0010E1C2E7|nr:hypothetical protein [Neorhizobium sp. R1-B]TDX85024.1 hypothetical protein EDE05_10549 [Neorhizobium sp. R1-B]
MQHPIPPHKIGQYGKEKLWYVSEFAQRFRLDKREENRLRKLLGPIAKEIDLLKNAGR